MVEFILKKSLEEHMPIKIIYNSKDNITQRDIRVIKFQGDSVIAFCYLRGETRKFKISSILSADFRRGYLH